MLTAFFSNIFLAGRQSYQTILLAQALFYLCAIMGFGFDIHGQRNKLFYIPFYFVIINLSQLFGLVSYLTQKYQPAWEKIER